MYVLYASFVLSAIAVLLTYVAISLIPSKEQRRREIVDVIAELKRMRAQIGTFPPNHEIRDGDIPRRDTGDPRWRA